MPSQQLEPYAVNTTASSMSAWNWNVTAAASMAPSRGLFERPEASVPTPMTYEDDGSVYGHLALWNSCHRGFMNGASGDCVGPPRTRTDYGQFHLGQIKTAEGDMLSVGKITFDAPHAPLTADLHAASKHYDDTGSVGAYVRARDGRLGIWLSGSLRPDLPPAGLVALRANPLSGDWRALNRNLELVAALAVPVPGFVVPALAASGEVEALLYSPDDWEVAMPSYSPSELRQRRLLLDDALTAAVLTTEQRNNLPRSAFAIPETREYPIHDRSHASDALSRSSGKPEEGRVRRAVCRRYPDMGECANN